MMKNQSLVACQRVLMPIDEVAENLKSVVEKRSKKGARLPEQVLKIMTVW